MLPVQEVTEEPRSPSSNGGNRTLLELCHYRPSGGVAFCKGDSLRSIYVFPYRGPGLKSKDAVGRKWHDLDKTEFTVPPLEDNWDVKQSARPAHKKWTPDKRLFGCDHMGMEKSKSLDNGHTELWMLIWTKVFGDFLSNRFQIHFCYLLPAWIYFCYAGLGLSCCEAFLIQSLFDCILIWILVIGKFLDAHIYICSTNSRVRLSALF